MNRTICDQCAQTMTATTGFTVRNKASLSSGSIPAEPGQLDLCSWRCMEDYARERAR